MSTPTPRPTPPWPRPLVAHRNRASALVVVVGVIVGLIASGSSPTSALAPVADCTNTSVGLIPLTESTGSDYLGATGGLYPDGSNTVPSGHLATGAELSTQIQPLSPEGTVDIDGTIAIITIGVSNTMTQSNSWINLSAGDAEIRPEVVIVNGAQSGEAVSEWVPVDGDPWAELSVRLDRANVTAAQVQAAWVNLPMRAETSLFPDTLESYSDDLAAVMRTLGDVFPNLRVAHLSSRTYGGYGSALSPEPVAYEHGFGVKWLIENQIDQLPGFNSDPSLGQTEMPWLAWGPYLWADGLTPRSDGLVWECGDFRSDGIHPSDSGAEKVALALSDFYKSDPVTCPWFSTLECPEPVLVPTVEWSSPMAAESVAGAVGLTIAASAPVVGVDWRIDGGPWTATTADPTGTIFTSVWDSTTTSDGPHQLDAIVVGAGDASITSIEVTVANGVVAPIQASIKLHCRGLSCIMDGSRSTGPDGLSYLWDFGDGTTATGSVATHEYAQAGSYTVSLTVSHGGVTDVTETEAVTRSR